MHGYVMFGRPDTCIAGLYTWNAFMNLLGLLLATKALCSLQRLRIQALSQTVFSVGNSVAELQRVASKSITTDSCTAVA